MSPVITVTAFAPKSASHEAQRSGVIKHKYFVTTTQQVAHDLASDKPTTSNYDCLHGLPLALLTIKSSSEINTETHLLRSRTIYSGHHLRETFLPL
jgi:hypothetical protein